MHVTVTLVCVSWKSYISAGRVVYVGLDQEDFLGRICWLKRRYCDEDNKKIQCFGVCGRNESIYSTGHGVGK